MSEDEFTIPVYYQSDADQSHLDDQTVAVLGYGSQGHAHSLNLHESGVDVVVGLREDSSSREEAEAEGLTVKDPLEATHEGDIIMFLVPDTVQPTVYEAVSPGIEAGDTVLFAHGFNIHYNQIEPQADVDVAMVAPKSPGHLVRRNYVNDTGTPALIAIEQDVSGETKELALAYADALGCARAGVIETTFQEEVESDLFGEQAVLCGGVTALVKHGFETLVDNGYAPEMAYFECLNELKLIVDLMYEGGLSEMWHSVSDTAEYGGLTQGERILGDEVRENMEEVLEEVQNGEFAREWITENQAGRPSYHQLVEAEENHQVEDVGERLRALFSWSEEQAVSADD